MSGWLKFFLDIIFPKNCLGCGQSNSEKNALCQECLKTIPINSGWFCPTCQRRLPTPKNFCHPATGFILAAAAPFSNKAVKETIYLLKYGKIENAVEDLTVLIDKYLEKTQKELTNWLSEETILIPIPLHRQKEKERGFNQSWLLTQAAIKILSTQNPDKFFSAEQKILERTKNTSSQTQCKNYDQRKKNIEGSFSIKNPEKIKNKTVIIVDDVFTSGATMREAIKIIKPAGAKKIMALVIAKA
ncbi:MAG: phosphoribosyltransferase family protein [bacterium]|nr:phosphoribosyltransferase family protein [bacterium]